jgi:hypothetical protein
MKMASMLKKVSGGIVVLAIGIIVIILYASGEHHIPVLIPVVLIIVGIVIVLVQRKEFIAETMKEDKK